MKPETDGSPSEWMSIPEAARALGVSRGTIYNRCVAGRLEWQRFDVGGREFVSVRRDSVERELAARSGDAEAQA